MFDEFKYYKPLIKNKYIIFVFILLKTIFSEETYLIINMLNS